MKYLALLLCIAIAVHAYDRDAAFNYAYRYWNTYNKNYHNYNGEGGDCANFVSQCLIAGEHPPLNIGDFPCRGYPCGVEEPGAINLQQCLRDYFGWEATCGYLQAPPDNIQPGDVLVYHSDGCGEGDSHATFVVQGAPNVQIACHSSNHYGIDYNYMADSKPYYNWLHINA